MDRLSPILVLFLVLAGGFSAIVCGQDQGRNAAALEKPMPPDAASLRQLALEYTLAISTGDKDKVSSLLPPSYPLSAELDSAIAMNRAIIHLADVLQENAGDREANALRGPGTNRAALQKSLESFEVRKRAYADGWILAYTPRPGVSRSGLASEFAFVESEQGWRVVPPNSPPLPSWRRQQILARKDRMLALVGEVATQVRERKLASAAQVRRAISQQLSKAMQVWQQEADTAFKEAGQTFKAQFKEVVVQEFDPQPVQELAFDQQGKTLAIGLINTPNSLHLLNVETVQVRGLSLSDDETERHVEALQFVGGQLAVAGAGFDRKRTEAARKNGQSPDFGVHAAADGKLRLFDPATGALTTTLAGHDGYTTDAVTADDTLYTVGTDNVLRAWRIEAAAANSAMLWERNFAQLGAPYGIAVIGSRVVIASPLSVIALTDRATGRALGNVSFLSGRLTAPLLGLSGNSLALGAISEVKLVDLSVLPQPDKGVDQQHSVHSDLPEQSLKEEWLGFSRVNDLAAAPAANLLVSGDGVPRPGVLVDPPHGPGVRFWSATDGEWIGWLPAPHPVTSVALSADARLLAIGDTKGRVRVLRMPEKLQPLSIELPDKK